MGRRHPPSVPNITSEIERLQISPDADPEEIVQHLQEMRQRLYAQAVTIQEFLGALLDQFNGEPTPHGDTHALDGDDPLGDAGEPRTLSPNLAADAGIGPAKANEDHAHALDLLLTAKGSLLTHDGTEYLALNVGADGQALVADSGEPSGLKWDTPAGGSSDDSSLFAFFMGD